MSDEAAKEAFWVWFDPLLEDYFCLSDQDEDKEHILGIARSNAMTPVCVHAAGRKEALDEAFPNWKTRSTASPRVN